MKQEIRLKNLSASARAGLEALIASQAHENLHKHLPQSESERATLFATLEKALSRQLFRVTLRLELPGRTLVSRGEDQDIGAASEAAFKTLDGRLGMHLTRLQHREPQPPERQRLSRLEEKLPQRARRAQQDYFEHVKEALPALTSFVQRELLYLRSSGQLSSDYPTAEDVVDEVLVRALDEWEEREVARGSGRRLLRLSIEVLAQRVAQARTELLEGLAFDGSDDVDPAEALYYQEQLGEWQSDEPRFETLMVTPESSDPREVAEFDQTRRFLLEALRSLPVSWRRMVMLSQMDDQPLEAVAAALDVDEETVTACLAHADAFLRERLQEAAIDLPDRGAPADYLVIEQPSSAVAAEVERELSRLLEGASRPMSASEGDPRWR